MYIQRRYNTGRHSFATHNFEHGKDNDMTLLAAQTLLIRDRMDWRKPHLKWVSDSFYRQFRWTSKV